MSQYYANCEALGKALLPKVQEYILHYMGGYVGNESYHYCHNAKFGEIIYEAFEEFISDERRFLTLLKSERLDEIVEQLGYIKAYKAKESANA